MTTPRTIVNADVDDFVPRVSPTLYALGLEIEHYHGYKIVKHDGQIGGSGSVHFFVPELKFGGSGVANSSEAGLVLEIIVRELIDEVLGVPISERPDWDEVERLRVQKYKNEQVKGDELKRELCPDFDGTCEPQKIPLRTYTGRYWNTGYKGLDVVADEHSLSIHAGDRSFPFTITFEHVCGQTKYVAHLRDHQEEFDAELKAEFRFENDVVSKMGVHFEDDLDELIWFHKVV